VAPGERVALIGRNAVYDDVAVAYVAILLAGASVVPLSSTQPRFELDRAVAGAQPSQVIVCDPALDPGWDARSLAELRSNGAPALPVLSPEAPAEVLSTSGTTGLPRLVEATHESLALDFEVEPYREPVPRHFVHALMLGTNIGQVALRSSLTLGWTVVALDTFDLDAYVRLAARLPMRETLLVPAMAATLGAEAGRHGWILPDAERVTVSGAATPAATWRQLAEVFPNAQLINSYTTAEAWPARVLAIVDPARPHSVGRPLDGHGVEVRDEAGLRVPPLARGTIWLSHRAVAPRRYADGSPAMAEAGWVQTDDLGHLDAEGFLYVEDRKSDAIVTGGFTVSTLEVEDALTQHPDVVAAAVVGLPHPILGSAVAAWVSGPPGIDLEDVGRVARERLAAHKVPSVIQWRETLPLTPGGKVAKRVLREELASREPATGTPPRAGVEAVIRTIWEDVLERPVAGVDLPFLALGGDSLSALRVISRIRAELVDDAPTGRLLAAATIAEQAELVVAAGGGR
jgi:acyl-CoA synthetase (AMP-forming)/AMP-acid ligase II